MKPYNNFVKTMKNQLKISVIIFFNFYSYCDCFEVPMPTIERLPKSNNYRVSIADVPGVKLIAFNGAINRKLEKYQSGDIVKIMDKPQNGVYSFLLEDINETDSLYYWIHVQFGHNIYHLLDKKFEFRNAITLNSDDYEISKENDKTLSDAIPEIPTTPPTIKICEPSITTVTNYNGRICKNHLIFEENFNEFNSSKWQKEIKFNGLDDEFVIYENKPENLFIKNGTLRIVPTLTNEAVGYEKITKTEVNLMNRCTETDQIDDFCQRKVDELILPPIISAKIRTKNSFSFRYGRIEIRAKLPKGDWIFPQLFLEPLTNIYASERNHEYAAGQMRIAFIRCNEVLESLSQSYKNYGGDRLLGGVVLTDVFEYQQNFYVESYRSEHLGDDYHIYSLLWTDKLIKLYIDNNNYATVPSRFSYRLSNVYPDHILQRLRNEGDMAPFNKDFYISLGVGVGGITNFPDNTETKNHVKKPWNNDDSAPEFSFWSDRDNWYKTWDREKSQMSVDYVKVYAV